MVGFPDVRLPGCRLHIVCYYRIGLFITVTFVVVPVDLFYRYTLLTLLPVVTVTHGFYIWFGFACCLRVTRLHTFGSILPLGCCYRLDVHTLRWLLRTHRFTRPLRGALFPPNGD